MAIEGIQKQGVRGCLGDAIVKSEHHHDGVRPLSGENAFGSGCPIGRLTLGLIPDETGDRLMLANNAHFRLFGIGVFKPISEPVRHGIPEHEYVALCRGISFLRRRRLGIILQDLPRRRMPGPLLPRYWLLEWRE